jgi:hypothetical protein
MIMSSVTARATDDTLIRYTPAAPSVSSANTWTQTQTFGASIQFLPQLSGKGPFLLDQTLTSANGSLNPAFFLGYNARPNGPHIVPSEPGLAFGLEADYNDGSGIRKMETYLQYQTAGAQAYVRPLFFQINRDTGFVTGMHVIGNPTQFAVNDGTPDGETRATIGLSIDGLRHSYLRLIAPPSKKSVLSLGYDGQDDVAKFLTATPLSANFNISGRLNSLWLFGRTHFGMGDSLSVGVEDNGAVATFSNEHNQPAVKGLVVRGIAGQTANLLEVQDSTSQPLFTVDKNGNELYSTSNGAGWIQGSISGLMWLSTSLPVSDTTPMLPADSIIEAVVYRITVAITGVSSFTIGDYANPARFVASTTTLGVGATGIGMEQVDRIGPAGPRQSVTAPVRVACDRTPTGGRIRITVFYRRFVPPSS